MYTLKTKIDKNKKKKARKEEEEVAQLNSDILSEILSRLRVKDLLRFKCVCKEWRHLISRQEFIKLHLENSIYRPILLNKSSFFVACPRLFPPPDAANYDLESTTNFTNMVFAGSSCDGLVCLLNDEHGIIHIWNPPLRSHACIPITKPRGYIRCFWFGRHNDEYKILLGTHTWGDARIHLIRPYNDGRCSYKSSHELRNNYHYLYDMIGTLFNGNVHWASVTRRVPLPPHVSIFSYDLVHESAGEVPIPEHMRGSLSLIEFKLGETNGCLSCLLKRTDGVSYESELWVMREYGVEESWTKVGISPSDRLYSSSSYKRSLRNRVPQVELDEPARIRSPFYTKQVYVESLVSPRQGARCDHSRFCCSG
ncbi:hypothetical protein ACP275_14G146100 [Erythranthe tilingii]